MHLLPASHTMTRHKWTTKEQETWLDERKPAFLVANQSRTAAKDFFPHVVKEFRDKWPVPPPTQEEMGDAGSLEMAERVKKGLYDKVCFTVTQSKNEAE